MSREYYQVSAEDALDTLARLLNRGDVVGLTVTDIDGETLAEVSGAAPAERAVSEFLDAFQEHEGGGAEVRIVADVAES
jgi:hypothetical protein